MTASPITSSARRDDEAPRLLGSVRFSTEGIHPYDQVVWTKRSIVQKDWKTGEIIFEQHDAEFPEFWSENAATIVTTKYFRGAMNTPQRETSLRQLIDRVVGKYIQSGVDDGYFSSKEESEIFRLEMTWLLLNQYFAFNSPVWFNVGTSSAQQVSACQPYHALVNTPSGPIPIGRLVEENRIGEKVLDAHGVTSIVAVKHNGRKHVRRIVTNSGHFIDVTDDHVVWRVGGNYNGSQQGWTQAKDIQPGDFFQWSKTLANSSEYMADELDIAEAGLAGWLQSDGCVTTQEKHYSSPMMEAITANEDEHQYVIRLIETVFPGYHYKESDVWYSDGIRRIRMYGKQLVPFFEKWNLVPRGIDMEVPNNLFTAPLPVVASYVRSVFQAEGWVSDRGNSALVGLQMISHHIVEGLQALLARFGIFARLDLGDQFDGSPPEQYSSTRDDSMRWPASMVWMGNLGDQRIFAEEIGFVASNKQDLLLSTLDRNGRESKDFKTLKVWRIIDMGEQEVYDIQTESGEYLSNNIRVHNCFILAVDDTMESILNWYREEGLIFKGGSGAGVNLSRIRSSKELLKSSGGQASGPVSFMRGADASAGTIKSGGATRRAAKMVVLDVDHPDIEEFIDTKSREEEKIRVLRDAGFDMDLGGRDINSVQYQNANNSVRVSDAFMSAVVDGESFDLKGRSSESVVDTVDAKALFRKMAVAAWKCADPGIQYDDTINSWHTLLDTSRIGASNPCSEYMSIDNSSCNLASLNLMKFRNEDGTFDIQSFVSAVEIIITAMEISISFGDFPTEAITSNTRRYRQLGIGYANLGALLMSLGLAYDSQKGRALAGAITSLMSAAAYRRSAEVARHIGAYDGYESNKSSHIAVMERHQENSEHLMDAVSSNSSSTFVSKGLVEPYELAHQIAIAATQEWESGKQIGTEHGWRNSQISLLAPTGTIGFMMDVDTTGVEPDFALKKFKKLVGGGSMEIVNQRVHDALLYLGYQEEVVEAIEAHILKHGGVVGAPGLKPEHYDVFDCAIGERSISHMGHALMMAAVQPFLSGAISKTINLPESATVEEIEQVYLEGWKLGLKALAVYRDNCKVGQPLSGSKKEEKKVEEQESTPRRFGEERRHGPRNAERVKLPKRRESSTTSFTVAGASGYLTAGTYANGDLGEVFLKLGKQGSTLAGVMDAFSIAVSIALQHGVPLDAFVSKFVGMRFEPAGMTDDEDIRMAQSFLDYIFRRLALDHMSYEDREHYQILTADERVGYLDKAEAEAAAGAPVESKHDAVRDISVDDLNKGAAKKRHIDINDTPMCLTCGTNTFMVRSGSCFACRGCGTTTGCS